jgi:hypothetical protein
MGFVDDYFGGYENLSYDSDGQPDFEASYEALLVAAGAPPSRQRGGARGGGSGGRGGRGGRGGGASGSGGGAGAAAAAAAQPAAGGGSGGLNPRAAQAVRELLASGQVKQALQQACQRQSGSPLACAFECEGDGGAGWRATAVLSDGTRVAGGVTQQRKRDAENAAAAAAAEVLLARGAPAPRARAAPSPASSAPAPATSGAAGLSGAPALLPVSQGVAPPGALAGHTVLVAGLQSRPELNGRAGRCGAFSDADGRYDIFLFGAPPGGAAGLRVRAANVHPAAAPRAGAPLGRDAPQLFAQLLECDGTVRSARVPLPPVADVSTLAELRYALRAALPALRHPRVTCFDLVRLDDEDEVPGPATRGRPASEDGVSWLATLTDFGRMVAAGARDGGIAAAVVLQSTRESLLDMSPLSDLRLWERAAGGAAAAAAAEALAASQRATVRAGADALTRLRDGGAELPAAWTAPSRRVSALEKLLTAAVDARAALDAAGAGGAAAPPQSDDALRAAAASTALQQPGSDGFVTRPFGGGGGARRPLPNDLCTLAMRARALAPHWRMPPQSSAARAQQTPADAAAMMARFGIPSMARHCPCLWLASQVALRARAGGGSELQRALAPGGDMRAVLDDLLAQLAVA